jgi:putative holliday junction resolvase
VSGFPSQGRVLGIDPGTRRIGVAVSDEARRVATPLEVVERHRDDSLHRRRIADLAREWEVGGLVVGLPRSLDGNEGPAARSARVEGTALQELVGLPVCFYDERLTTVIAEQSLAAAGVPGSGRRARVDMVAATVLLQAWLDHQRATASDEHR